MSTFIDTSAFFAIANSADQRHEPAVRAWLALTSGQEHIVTSSYVVAETISLLHGRHGTQAVRRFVDGLLPVVLVEWVDAHLHTTALSALLASPGRHGPSLTDCVSFEIIRESRIDTVFAYDRHFHQRGHTLIGQ